MQPYVPPMEILEEFVDMEVNGETRTVHHIQMKVYDGVDRTGGLAVLFDIPEGRPIIVSGEDARTPGDALPDKVDKRVRVVFPMFDYDKVAGIIVGEEGYNAKTGEVTRENPGDTLEQRLEQVIAATEQHGFGLAKGFKGGHLVWVTQDGPGFKHPKHALGCLPFAVTLDDMHLIVPIRMVKHTRV